MADIKYGVSGVLGMVIALLLTVFGWFMVDAGADIMPSSELKIMYWVGFLLYWVLAVIVTPILMIMGGQGNFKGAVFGIGAFIGGYVLSILVYYVGGAILETMNGIYPNATFNGIGWFAIYTIWILALIVAPAYLTIKDSIQKG